MASNVMVMSFVQWYESLEYLHESVLLNIFDINFLIRLMGKSVPTRSIWWVSTFEVVKWEMEPSENCVMCGGADKEVKEESKKEE
jgi:hypothetical protein